MCMSLSVHAYLCVCASLSLDRYNPYQLGQGSMHLQFQYSYGEMGCGNRKSCKLIGELAWGGKQLETMSQGGRPEPINTHHCLIASTCTSCMHTPTQTPYTHICERVCSLRFQRLRV